MKKIILACCFFCFFGFSNALKSTPLELINSLKEEMNPNNRQFITSLITIEVKKNNIEIEHLNSLLSINIGGKAIAQINRKKDLQIKIEKLEKQNNLLLNNL
jgi:predicted RecB family endonuclease